MISSFYLFLLAKHLVPVKRTEPTKHRKELKASNHTHRMQKRRGERTQMKWPMQFVTLHPAVRLIRVFEMRSRPFKFNTSLIPATYTPETCLNPEDTRPGNKIIYSVSSTASSFVQCSHSSIEYFSVYDKIPGEFIHQSSSFSLFGNGELELGNKTLTLIVGYGFLFMSLEA